MVGRRFAILHDVQTNQSVRGYFYPETHANALEKLVQDFTRASIEAKFSYELDEMVSFALSQYQEVVDA